MVVVISVEGVLMMVGQYEEIFCLGMLYANFWLASQLPRSEESGHYQIVPIMECCW